eukprot:7533682-Pyramimonas_sp.AAC.1
MAAIPWTASLVVGTSLPAALSSEILSGSSAGQVNPYATPSMRNWWSSSCLNSFIHVGVAS